MAASQGGTTREAAKREPHDSPRTN